MIGEYERAAREEGAFQENRDSQSLDWLRHLIGELLQLKLSSNPAAKALKAELEKKVAAHEITPYNAARQIIDCL